MTPDSFPASYRGRLRWAFREGSILGAIFIFWLAVGIALLVVTGLFAMVIETLRIRQLRFVYELLRWDGVVWSAILPLASATSGLYVLVRTGTILIDRFQRPVDA